MNIITHYWRQASTKIGLLLGALSPVLTSYASIDPMFGYAGAACGILLVIWNQKPVVDTTQVE